MRLEKRLRPSSAALTISHPLPTSCAALRASESFEGEMSARLQAAPFPTPYTAGAIV
jgi:hypothetical protein